MEKTIWFVVGFSITTMLILLGVLIYGNIKNQNQNQNYERINYERCDLELGVVCYRDPLGFSCVYVPNLEEKIKRGAY